MASDQSFVEYVCDQLGGADHITFRKMFGEYALYCDGKVVALVCDNQVFVKPTAAALAALGDADMAPAYPGGRPQLRLGAQLDDRVLMSRVIRQVADELPAPKPKKPAGAKRAPAVAAKAKA